MSKKINLNDLYVPWYNKAIRKKILHFLNSNKIYIEVFLKGGRFSGKSYYIAIQILELMYRDPSMSAAIIAMQYKDHFTRGLVLVKTILNAMDLAHEWKWKGESTNPVASRSVNGYTQEIRFLSLTELETAGFEPPVNPVTGKKGYFGIIWDDEMAKKTDSNPDADFEYIIRLKDAIATAKNTFVRFLANEHAEKQMFIFHSLNPWGEGNPLVRDFHNLLPDDINKLKTKGYNVGYETDDDYLKICGTTNYIINTKLNEKAKRSIRILKLEKRAATMIYGATGRTLNATFARELALMEKLCKNRKNIPSDADFMPLVFSMDIGTSSASTLYLIGCDKRYNVKSGGETFPTRFIAKAEYVADPKSDLKTVEERYKSILIHINNLRLRWPQIAKNGITVWIDASAVESMTIFRLLIKEMKNEDPTCDIDEWLSFKPQVQKWKSTEQRSKRQLKFSELVGNYALIVDKDECPVFYEMTGKIVSAKTEQEYDHSYDGLMYGIMAIQDLVWTGIGIKLLQNKPNTIEKEDE